MTIDELNALTTLTAADEVPVWDSEESGEPTKKITASNLSASVKSLGSLIGTGDLDSTPTSGSNKAVTSGGVYTAIQQRTAKVKVLTAVVPVSAYSYSLGGYQGSISITTMNGYDAGLSSRTLGYIPISCYYSTNGSVGGVASIFGDNESVLVNGSNAGDYYIRVLQIYI